MKKYQKYDVVTGQEFVGDIQLNDVEFINSIICEVDISNNGNIAVDDVVFVLENGKIIKAIANNAYCNYQIGIVKAIDGTSYTVQIDGIVEHSQTLVNDMSKEVYATSNSDSRNLVDKLEAPFFNDDTAVIVGKKLSQNKIKLSPEFYVFGDPEPNFLNDDTLMVHFPFSAEFGKNDALGNITTSYGFAPGITEPTFEDDMFGNANKSIRIELDTLRSIYINPNSIATERLTAGYDSISTICFVKINSLNLESASNSSCIFHWSASLGSSEGYGFYYRGGNNRFYTLLKKAGIPYGNAIADSISRNNWYVLITVHDRIERKTKIYTNSILRGSYNDDINSSDYVGYNNSYTRIGRWGNDSTHQLYGNLSSLRVIRKALSEKEIKRYFQYCNTWKVAL